MSAHMLVSALVCECHMLAVRLLQQVCIGCETAEMMYAA